MTMTGDLWSRIVNDGERPFWIGRDETRTYNDLAGAVRAMTAQIDIEPNGRVAICTKDDWVAFVAWLAAFLNGMTPVLLAGDTKQDRLDAICQHASPTTVILNGVVPGSEGYEPTCLGGPEDPGNITFTSGTTGRPKGVVATRGNLFTNLRSTARLLQFDQSGRMFNGLSFSHVDGLLHGPVMAAFVGGTLVRPLPFSIQSIDDDLSWLAAERATHMIGSPTLFELVDRHATRDDYFRHPEFVALVSSSARLSPALWDRLEARFGVTVVNEYGMTETTLASHLAGDLPGLGKKYTIGRPYDCKAKLIGPDGSEAAENEPGEMFLSGDNIFAGYLKDPSQTKSTLTDGWLRTGDICLRTETGDFKVVGRNNTSIISGGHTISPEEIDELLEDHPDILDVRTIGVEDDVFGQVPLTAFVSANELTQDELAAFCRARLESHKVPRRFVRLDALPRTASFKVDIMALKELAAPERSETADTDTGQILEIAADVLGVSKASISLATTPDTTEGWDSYAHMVLILEVERAFGVNLSASEVQGIGSLSDLLSLVRDQDAPTRVEDLRSGEDATIILLPSVIGRTGYFRHYLDGIDPHMAIKNITLELDDFTDETTLHDLADLAAQEIASTRPAEPIFTLGFSFGGFLAHEVAIRLRSLGLNVAGVVNLDAVVPKEARHFRFGVRDKLQKAARRIGLIKEDALGFGGLNLDNVPEDRRDLAIRCLEAVSEYRPKHGSVPMLLVASNARPTFRTLWWSDYTSGDITRVTHGAVHAEIVRSPEVCQAVAVDINAFTRGLLSQRQRLGSKL